MLYISHRGGGVEVGVGRLPHISTGSFESGRGWGGVWKDIIKPFESTLNHRNTSAYRMVSFHIVCGVMLSITPFL